MRRPDGWIALCFVPLLFACALSGAEEGGPSGLPAPSSSSGTVSTSAPLTLRLELEGAETEGRPLRLLIEARRPPGRATPALRIYLEHPDADAETGIDVASYVGSVAFGQRGEPAPDVERFVLQLDEVVEELGGVAAPGTLDVTFVAVPISEDTDDLPAVRIESARLVRGELPDA